MSKSQRTKGAVGEREVCDLILRDLGIEVHRNLQQTRDGGADIKLKPFSKSKDALLLATSTTGLIRLNEDVSFQSVRLLSVELTEKNG